MKNEPPKPQQGKRSDNPSPLLMSDTVVATFSFHSRLRFASSIPLESDTLGKVEVLSARENCAMDTLWRVKVQAQCYEGDDALFGRKKNQYIDHTHRLQKMPRAMFLSGAGV
jgi:hypothetical protein